MRIVSSFLPPTTSQPQLRGDQGKPENAREVFAELVDDNSVPVTTVAKIDTVSQHTRWLSERVDLRLLREETASLNNLPLNNLRAMASYQSIAADSVVSGNNIARLDIIV